MLAVNELQVRGFWARFNAFVTEWISERARGSTQGLGEYIRERAPTFRSQLS
jgi:hypothetical protein